MMAPPWMRVSERWSQRSFRSLRMVCAETSKRRARSSTITRPKARARLRISFWRWVRPVMTAPRTEGASCCGGSAVRSTRQIGLKRAPRLNIGLRLRQSAPLAVIAMTGIRSQTQHHGRTFTRPKRVLDKTERGCKTAPNQKNGGSDEYRPSSADLAGACVWIVERGWSEHGPGVGGFGG